jgi:hypothetical protein
MEPGESPQVQAVAASPINGQIPPAEHRFKPGESGNPGGRPKGACPRASMLRQIAEKPNEHGEGAKAAQYGARYLQLLELIAATDDPKLVERYRGELAELRDTFAETEGRPTQYAQTGEHTSTSIQASFVAPRAPETP